MNGDLVSRAEAIDIIRSMTISLGGIEIFHPEAKKSVLCALDELPAVDAVPVVRCKDCINHGQCIFEDTFTAVRMTDGYCRCGKRKEAKTV